MPRQIAHALPRSSFAAQLASHLSLLALLLGTLVPAEVAIAAAPTANTVTIEAFVRQDSEQCRRALTFLNRLARERRGIELRVHDVMQDKQALSRVWQLARRFKREKAGAPTIYLCDRIVIGFRDAETTGRAIEDMLTIRAYLREGCSKCRAAKEYLAGFRHRWPAIRVAQYDVIRDASAQRRMMELAAKFQVRTPVVPAFHLGGRFLVGWRGTGITGEQIESVFRNGLPPLPQKAAQPVEGMSWFAPRTERLFAARTTTIQPFFMRQSLASIVPLSSSLRLTSSVAVSVLFGAMPSPAGSALNETFPTSRDITDSVARAPPTETETPVSSDGIPRGETQWQEETTAIAEAVDADEVPIPYDEPGAFDQEPVADDLPLFDDLPLVDEIPLVDDIPDASAGSDFGVPVGEADSPQSIELPFFGSICVSELGLPLFTFLIGLVDGFNPCAMWVLVFLLSILVNIKDRRKILAIAGSFVLVSGLAYFAFMAAWLNVFQLFGLQRRVQVVLGLLGITIGLINVKDFFAFRQGITLSIPESAKPGIYRRVRQIVTTQYMSVAIAGAISLAVVVNIIELLCTAGLPALYTQVLTMQELPMWADYAYLALYIVAYMLDDSILVAIVVVTLSHRRLQEREGRWLKLLSGLVLLGLGILMIVKPELLSYGG